MVSTLWQAYLSSNGRKAPRGPKPGLSISDHREIIMLLLLFHSLRYNYLKSLYQGNVSAAVAQLLSQHPGYEHFVNLQKSVFVPLMPC